MRSLVGMGCTMAAAVAVVSGSVRAVPIYGGPTYDSTTQTGYQSALLPFNPGNTAGNGVGVGWTNRYESGSNKRWRAVRWDTSGWVELGHLGLSSSGATESFAYAVNTVGTAVGTARKYELGSGKGDRAVRWGALETAATELGHLGLRGDGYTESRAYAINASGTAIGYAYKFESGSYLGNRAVRWDAAGTSATELGHLGLSSSGSTMSEAHSINAAGTAVGLATKYDGSGIGLGSRAVRWDASGTAAAELGNLGTDNSGSTNSVAYAINNAGVAVGFSTKYESGSNKGNRAVRWDASGTVATELENLGTDSSGSTGTSYGSRAVQLNTAGTAVGFAVKFESGIDKGLRAVRWDAAGTSATELGHLGVSSNGSTESRAHDINDAGIVVGYAREHNSTGGPLGNRAVAWGVDGAAFNLNTVVEVGSGWVSLSTAADISDTYWITGIGQFDPDNTGPQAAYDRLFLLDAISLFGTHGDATRNGVVDFDDLLIVAQHYGSTIETTWDTGDFNTDGIVSFDDLLALAQNYQPAGLAPFEADWALARSLMPEPTLLAASLSATALLRRRRVCSTVD